MKLISRLLTMFFVLWISQSFVRSDVLDFFVSSLAKADVIGLGINGGSAGENKRRIDQAVFWLGDPGTNSVILTASFVDDGVFWDWSETAGDFIFFWGVRKGWNQHETNLIFKATPHSAWELREKLTQAGAAEQMPSPPFEFPGDWINITTNSPATLNFISNVVHTLCVEPNLIEYSQALIPPLKVEEGNELFLFKADAFMEMTLLQWGEDEPFLVHVLNSSQYPRQFRGLALSYLQDRFGWPETNTVPEL